VNPAGEAPYPPIELADRVFGIHGWTSDPMRTYAEMGAQTHRTIVSLLPKDWSFEGKRVLDFGCGAGRTLRHFLPHADEAEFWGTDIDRRSIAWLEANLSPPLHPWHGHVLPPLGLEHESFDLIYAVSVFTHLTNNSTPWLLELHKLLKPGGLLIPSYMGRWISEVFTGEPWDDDRHGRTMLRHTWPWERGGPAVLISDWWMREHWGRAFDIVTVTPEMHNMTWPLLRKREVEITTEELDEPADDPREYEALKTNLRLLIRDAVLLEEEHRQETEALEARIRGEYEGSTSWRVTAPARAAARRRRRGRRGTDNGDGSASAP
jgi:SAM-dependent methyltransferase